MKNLTAELLKLYCTNIHCRKSVYNEIEDVSVSLTFKNILETHLCCDCLKPLSSAADLEMEEILAVAAIKLPN